MCIGFQLYDKLIPIGWPFDASWISMLVTLGAHWVPIGFPLEPKLNSIKCTLDANMMQI